MSCMTENNKTRIEYVHCYEYNAANKRNANDYHKISHTNFTDSDCTTSVFVFDNPLIPINTKVW